MQRAAENVPRGTREAGRRPVAAPDLVDVVTPDRPDVDLPRLLPPDAAVGAHGLPVRHVYRRPAPHPTEG